MQNRIAVKTQAGRVARFDEELLVTKRIKILHLSASFAVGGAEMLVLGLAEQSDDAHFETHVCSLHEARGNALKPDFARLGINIHNIDARRFYDPRSIRELVRYVRQHQIDVIHTHLFAADVIGRIAGRIAGVPVLSTLQNEPRSFKTMRTDRRWLERITARYLTTKLVTVSKAVRELFIKEWNIPAAHIEVIYNAVPVERYLNLSERPVRGEFGDGPVITNVGRLHQQKAQHLLLEAAQRLLPQWPTARFLIVGKGRREEELKQHAANLGVADHVVFTGLRRDIPEILAQSDVFVLSSLWEGLPLSAVEAMAAARPVVLTDVGGNRELVESGRQGVIVQPNDVTALTTAISGMLQDPNHAMAMGKAGRERVRHDFNIGTITHQYESLYTRLAQPHRQGLIARQPLS